MKTELSQFNELKAAIAIFVAPAAKIKVSDFASSQRAIEVAKQVKAYLNQVETTRKAMTDPLLAEQKRIKAYADDIKMPLEEVEIHIKRQIAAFTDEQTRIRAIEARRLDEERRKAEAEAAERARIEAEALRAKQEEEAAKEQEAAAIFGSDDDEEAESVEVRHAREQAELQAKLDQEAALRTARAREQAYDLDQQRVKGTKRNWKCEVIDITKVPREFLTITLNDKAVLAAARGGVTEIAGVRLWQETTVAIGATTYVPLAALQKEEAGA